MKNILIEIRVKHYVKNIIVFLPLVFSLNLPDTARAVTALLVFAAFCAGSSAVYVINDIADAPRDRLHPAKKMRPIASGAISAAKGRIIAAVCMAAAAGLAVPAGLAASALLAVYVALNIAYSFWLKHYVIADVFCVMTGFILRVQAGAAAINVPVSDWLLLTVMALSLFMAFGKRRAELCAHNEGRTRAVLGKYTAAFLDKAMYAMMTLSIAFYALWAIDPATRAHLGADRLIWTTPLAVAGLLRYAQLVEGGVSEGDPTGVIFTDIPIRVIIVVFAAVVVASIYIF